MSKNTEFDKKVLEVCDKRNVLGISVKGRIRLTTGLLAADAVYYSACDSCFITGKQLPKKYSETRNLASPG